MSYLVLARKWRPTSLAELVGQTHVTRALRYALSNDCVHHAYLFTGTRGVGKTTIARIIAKALNCEQGMSAEPCNQCPACTAINEGRFLDLIEVDAASRTKVEDTRELLDNVQYAPTQGRYKVYLIDEVHMLSGHSFNALLKTLEEPPAHVKFLLATTDPQKLPVTVLSRCLQFHLKNLLPEQISGQLEHILNEEKIKADNSALALIADAARGSMRDALSLLDQVIADGQGQVKIDTVRELLGTVSPDNIDALLECLANKTPENIQPLSQALAENGADFSAVLATLTAKLHQLAMACALNQADNRFNAEDIQLYYQIALMSRQDLSLAPSPKIGFEMAMLRMLAFTPVGPQIGATPPTPKATKPAPSNAKPPQKPVAAKKNQSISESDWPEFLKTMPITGMALVLAQNSKLMIVQENHWQLLLNPVQAPLHNATLVERLARAVSQTLGRKIRLEVIISDNPIDTPASARAQAANKAHKQAVSVIENDKTAKALAETFGANIDAKNIEPLTTEEV